MLTLLEYIEREKIDIDRDILRKMIDIIDSEWIYLSDEIIIEWMGYKKSKSTISNFSKEMKKKYQTNIDYKEVDRAHLLVDKYYKSHPPLQNRGGNRKKYYIITSETCITSLIIVDTIISRRYAKYFYRIHDLMIKYHKYQTETLKEDYMQSINKLCKLPHIELYSKLQNILYLDLALQEKNKMGLVYFIHEIDNVNAFKIGFTANLAMRLECLQISNLKDLVVYKKIYTVNPVVLENIIHKYLKSKLIHGEWYAIDENEIDAICDEVDND